MKHLRIPRQRIHRWPSFEWQKGDLLEQIMELIIGATRNWAKSVALWNLVLDQNHQPFLGGCKTCRGVVTARAVKAPDL
jgi:hypothetical protein